MLKQTDTLLVFQAVYFCQIYKEYSTKKKLCATLTLVDGGKAEFSREWSEPL